MATSLALVFADIGFPFNTNPCFFPPPPLSFHTRFSLNTNNNRFGTKVWVDSSAIIKILGSTMDYVENDLGSEFVFENPNAKGACGCGESWHM